MQRMPSATAVVLSSGGLDSTTCLALALAEGHQVLALSFDYGQRHAVELERAQQIVEIYRARSAAQGGPGQIVGHLTSEIRLFRQIGGSALTAGLDLPLDRSAEAMADSLPSSYVPARNLIFLSHAAGVAEVCQARAIYIGVNALDYSGYPDCRPAFIEAFEATANLATSYADRAQKLKIETPLQVLSKAQIVALALAHDAPLVHTTSCYTPDEAGRACGRCDACTLRLKGFLEAGAVDPIEYQPGAPRPDRAAEGR